MCYVWPNKLIWYDDRKQKRKNNILLPFFILSHVWTCLICSSSTEFGIFLCHLNAFNRIDEREKNWLLFLFANKSNHSFSCSKQVIISKVFDRNFCYFCISIDWISKLTNVIYSLKYRNDHITISIISFYILFMEE